MARPTHAPRRMRGLRAWTGAALALSFVFVGAIAGQHSHAGTAEAPVACAVCASTHQAPITTAVTPLAIAGLDVRAAKVDVAPESAPTSATSGLPHSRAPPA